MRKIGRLECLIIVQFDLLLKSLCNKRSFEVIVAWDFSLTLKTQIWHESTQDKSKEKKWKWISWIKLSGWDMVSGFGGRAAGGEIELKAGWTGQGQERGGLGGWAKEEERGG